jgi:peptidoglycan/LPS O-acetylase OafA/YrhL
MPAKQVYFPNLDGWRFVAFLAVFYHHSFYTASPEILDSAAYKLLKSTTTNGELGVDFFFVLSGFLIIYLLITEKLTTGRIDAKKFYIRRVLRIFPLYYLCLFFGFIVMPQLKVLLGSVPSESARPAMYLAFLANIDIIWQQNLPDSGVLGILWSVSIEEQFYFVIPVMLLLLPIRYYPHLFLGVILASLALRGANADSYYFIKFHTFASMGNLAIGGLAAYFSAIRPGFPRFFENLHPVWILLCYVLLIAVLLLRSEIFQTGLMRTFEASLIALLFAAVILEQNYSRRSLFKMARNRIFTQLGKYTYGLYCLHLLAALIVIVLVTKLRLNTSLWQIVFVQTPLMLIVSILLAYLSYELYEKRFLNLKKKFAVIASRPRST